MGARISISFQNKNEESVTLFNHWGGEEFLQTTKNYVQALTKREDNITPLDRLDPNTVMVDFIRHLTKKMKRAECDLYLGRNHNDGDNSDFGHYTINLERKT